MIGFKYIRHIDDYKCYCKTREEADLFIATLSKTLHKYKMNLNDKKTMILELPQPNTEKYIRRFRSLSKKVGKNIHSKNIEEWQSFVDEAVEHSKSTNDSNALRFLFSVISTAKADRGNASSFNLIFLRLLGLCHHYYNLLEKLISFVENNEIFVDDNIKSLMTEAMEQIITKCNSSQKSEPVVWAFYLAIRYNLDIKFDDEELIGSEDYLPILMGYLYRYMKAENADNTDKTDKTEKYLTLAKLNKPSAWLFNYQVCFLSTQNAQCLEDFRKKKISFLNKDLEKMIDEHREQNR